MFTEQIAPSIVGHHCHQFISVGHYSQKCIECNAISFIDYAIFAPCEEYLKPQNSSLLIYKACKKCIKCQKEDALFGGAEDYCVNCYFDMFGTRKQPSLMESIKCLFNKLRGKE